MARPIKTGLDYFSFDVDFYDNKKVRKVIRACGPAAGSVLSCLLCNIYQWKGYYILWDQDLPFDIAEKVGVSEGAVTEIMTKAIQVGFFDQDLFNQYKILTSSEIQKRYKAGTLKRADAIITPEYIVIDGKNRVNAVNNQINDGSSTQSKGNQSKGNSLVVAVATPPTTTKDDFKNLVADLTGKDLKTVWSGLRDYIATKQPNFIEPYHEAWNLFAKNFGLAQVEIINDSRKKKFKVRIEEKGFDFVKILSKIQASNMLKGTDNNWRVTFDWIFENDKNYLKILEGNYDN